MENDVDIRNTHIYTCKCSWWVLAWIKCDHTQHSL